MPLNICIHILKFVEGQEQSKNLLPLKVTLYDPVAKLEISAPPANKINGPSLKKNGN